MFATTLEENNIVYNNDLSFNFIDQSNKINSSMQELNLNLSEYINSLPTFKDKFTTVLFLKNENLMWDNSDKSKTQINEFCMEQPILYSQIYSDINNKDFPGFGMYFPTPINNDANTLFDNWFEIGASAISNSNNKLSISQRLVSAFSSTADIVFYLYDSNQIGSNEEDFINYVYNSNNSNKFWPLKLLKDNSICKHIIPIDMQWLYFGLWDQVGSFIMNYLFAQIFYSIDKNNGDVKPIFDNKIYFEKNISYDQIKIPSNEITNLFNKSKWKPSSNLYYIYPAETQSEPSNQNYLSTLYNLVGHSISLGILPNYIMRFNEMDSNKKYNELPGYLDWLKNDILEKWNDKDNFLKINRLSNSLEIENLHLFAISANRDIFGKNGIWPLPNISTFHDTTPDGIDDAISQINKNIKRIYSERNDTKFTQYSPKGFDMKIYNSNDNKITTISEFLK